MLALVENARRKQIAWIEAVLDHRKWRPSRLAREAGVDHSTISKFLNDPLNIAQLNTYTVEKIAEAGGIPPYLAFAPQAPRGMAEDEAAPYAPGGDPLAGAVAALRAGRNGVDAWVMKSRALEHAGVLPNDVLIVDLNGAPRDGDVVCAQLYDRNGRAETVFRIFEHPFLVAACGDPALRRPVLVDNDRALVRGVVEATLRPRAA